MDIDRYGCMEVTAATAGEEEEITMSMTTTTMMMTITDDDDVLHVYTCLLPSCSTPSTPCPVCVYDMG